MSPEPRPPELVRGVLNHDGKMNLAREIGITPLSLKTILDQLGPAAAGALVLFDTVPARPGFAKFKGDHWRILKRSKKSAKLQQCDSFGLEDIVGVEPLTLSLEEPFFTGAYFKKYVYTGRPVSLEKAQKFAKNKDRSLASLARVFDKIEDVMYWSEGAYLLWQGQYAQRDYKLPQFNFSKSYLSLKDK